MLLYLKLPAEGYFSQCFTPSVVIIETARWGGSVWSQLRGGTQAEVSGEGGSDWKYVSAVGFHCRPPLKVSALPEYRPAAPHRQSWEPEGEALKVVSHFSFIRVDIHAV